jgi:hypothetical protein
VTKEPHHIAMRTPLIFLLAIEGKLRNNGLRCVTQGDTLEELLKNLYEASAKRGYKPHPAYFPRIFLNLISLRRQDFHEIQRRTV